jgi:hypothetical protein
MVMVVGVEGMHIRRFMGQERAAIANHQSAAGMILVSECIYCTSGHSALCWGQECSAGGAGLAAGASISSLEIAVLSFTLGLVAGIDQNHVKRGSKWNDNRERECHILR